MEGCPNGAPLPVLMGMLSRLWVAAIPPPRHAHHALPCALRWPKVWPLAQPCAPAQAFRLVSLGCSRPGQGEVGQERRQDPPAEWGQWALLTDTAWGRAGMPSAKPWTWHQGGMAALPITLVAPYIALASLLNLSHDESDKVMEWIMNINEFPNLNAVGASMRSGGALIALDLDSEWVEGREVSGNLSIHEDGEELGRWIVTVREDGAVEQQADDFYRALELFEVIRHERHDKQRIRL